MPLCDHRSRRIVGVWLSLIIATALPALVWAAVTITNFTAQAGATTITVRWETGSETDFSGFQLYRSTSPANTSATALGFFPGQGDLGGTYTHEDSTAARGTTYYYFLKILNSDGSTDWHEQSASATIGAAAATATSTQTATTVPASATATRAASPTSTPNAPPATGTTTPQPATATRTATAQPAATATTQPVVASATAAQGSTNQPEPTATRAPSSTPTPRPAATALSSATPTRAATTLQPTATIILAAPAPSATATPLPTLVPLPSATPLVGGAAESLPGPTSPTPLPTLSQPTAAGGNAPATAAAPPPMPTTTLALALAPGAATPLPGGERAFEPLAAEGESDTLLLLLTGMALVLGLGVLGGAGWYLLRGSHEP